ncbi:MAG: hypothetical protein EP332_10435 [Bacteroidetes bacterium]|nr:MAG: hypothetical protein EP332_10435 [Bacteroidota bacterium]
MTRSFTQVEHNTPEWRAAVKLREDVLRKPLGSFFSDAELEAEKEHIHVVGYDNGELLATAVLVPEGNQFKMQRVAVQPNLRS